MEFIQPYFESFGLPFCAVLVFVALDVVFGFAGAVINKEVSSQKMREGVGHKLGIVGAIVLSMIVEAACDYVNLGIEVPVVGATAAYLVLMEAWSVCENLVKMNPELSGLPIFSLIKKAVDSNE